MSNYPLENLRDDEFEELVIRICLKWFGEGCQKFTAGKDGGRDSWFSGTANEYPSSSAPWSGTIFIQAKHTKSPYESCSDNKFSGTSATSILSKEVERLKVIKANEDLDGYLLFTNRRQSGLNHSDVTKRICEELSIDKADIIAKDKIELFLDQNEDIVFRFGLHKFMLPMRFNEKDLRDVVLAFGEQREHISLKLSSNDFSYISKEDKNKINNLSDEYYEFIRTRSLQHFDKIESFLLDPRNIELAELYESVVDDLRAQLIIYRTRYSSFDLIIEELKDYIVKQNPDMLTKHKTLIRTFLHFMYYNCDIGKKVV